jgi:hypothetical protein
LGHLEVAATANDNESSGILDLDPIRQRCARRPLGAIFELHYLSISKLRVEGEVSSSVVPPGEAYGVLPLWRFRRILVSGSKIE